MLGVLRFQTSIVHPQSSCIYYCVLVPQTIMAISDSAELSGQVVLIEVLQDLTRASFLVCGSRAALYIVDILLYLVGHSDGTRRRSMSKYIPSKV